MYVRRLAIFVAILGLGVLLATAGGAQQPSPPAAQDQQQDQQQDQEVLARGPVHEAYAEPIDNNPQPTKVIPKEPPPPIEELPPDQKPAGENVQWIPGYWSYDDDRNDYIWVSGVWRTPPPDRNWLPGHWNQVNGGWQWTPGFWMAVQAGANDQGSDSVQYLPPPPEPVNAAVSTPAPNPGSVFVPGIWVYRDTRYLWRPGFWVDYRPGWVWIPAHYVWTPVGFVFIEGYWDMELSQRGLVFAPVYFRRPLWTDSSWYFQPNYLVYNDFLSTALFVRPGAYSYYFGNYFEPQYRRRGFVPWIDYRIGNTGYDPLFSYYRWSHRDDRRAVTDLRDLYSSRFNGTAARPPITLVQQNTLIQNSTNNRATNVTNVRNVTALASLRNAGTAVRLQPVARAQQLQEQKFAQNMRQASLTRAKSEATLMASHSEVTGANAKPVSVNVNLPRARAQNNAVAGMRPPPAPAVAQPTIGQGAAGRPAGIGGPDRTHETTTRPNEAPTRPAPRTEPMPQARPPVSTEPRRDPRPPEAAPPRPEPRPQPKTEPQPQPKTEPRPAPKVEPRPQPRPEPPPRPQPPRKDDKKGG